MKTLFARLFPTWTTVQSSPIKLHIHSLATGPLHVHAVAVIQQNQFGKERAFIDCHYMSRIWRSPEFIRSLPDFRTNPHD